MLASLIYWILPAVRSKHAQAVSTKVPNLTPYNACPCRDTRRHVEELMRMRNAAQEGKVRTPELRTSRYVSQLSLRVKTTTPSTFPTIFSPRSHIRPKPASPQKGQRGVMFRDPDGMSYAWDHALGQVSFGRWNGKRLKPEQITPRWSLCGLHCADLGW